MPNIIGGICCSVASSLNSCKYQNERDKELAELKEVAMLRATLPIHDISWGEAEDLFARHNIELMLKSNNQADFYLHYTDTQWWQKLVPYLTYSGEYYAEALDVDCITGDTPIWIRTSEGVSLIEVRELIPYGGYAEASNIQIFTRKGFVPLHSVRRKKSKKPIIRLLDSSDIGLTVDHKIIANPSLLDGKYVAAEYIAKEQLIKVIPSCLTEGIRACDTPFTYELAWAHGLFCAEGSAHIRKHGGNSGAMWNIRCGNEGYLERAMSALSLEYPEMKFYINNYPSEQLGAVTNYGPRKLPIHHLLCTPRERHNDGAKGLFVRKFRMDFYNSFGVKRVPIDILNGTMVTAMGFYDGIYAGDGGPVGVTSSSKLETMGLSVIVIKMGQNPRVTNDKGCSLVHGSSYYKTHERLKLRKTRHPGVEDVYDVSTENGEFIAGDVAIKNCDDYSKWANADSSKRFRLNGCVQLWGNSPYGFHAFSGVITGPDTIRIFEPNASFPCAGELLMIPNVYGWEPTKWKP